MRKIAAFAAAMLLATSGIQEARADAPTINPVESISARQDGHRANRSDETNATTATELLMDLVTEPPSAPPTPPPSLMTEKLVKLDRQVTPPPGLPAPLKVRVAPNESLSLLAKRHGVDVQRLFAANTIANPCILFVNQELVIPSPDQVLPDKPMPECPQPEPPPQAKGAPAQGGSNYAAGNGGVWAALRRCESGGNYAANTGNGFYGAYQFTISTWDSMGTGYARADLAPPSVQDDAARRLQARAGWGQWPHCSSQLGLR